MHKLPNQNSKLRELFSVEDVVKISSGELPVNGNVWELRGIAKKAFKNKAIKRVYYFNVNSKDELTLISFGRRLARRVEWCFGPITRQTKLI